MYVFLERGAPWKGGVGDSPHGRGCWPRAQSPAPGRCAGTVRRLRTATHRGTRLRGPGPPCRPQGAAPEPVSRTPALRWSVASELQRRFAWAKDVWSCAVWASVVRCRPSRFGSRASQGARRSTQPDGPKTCSKYCARRPRGHLKDLPDPRQTVPVPGSQSLACGRITVFGRACLALYAFLVVGLAARLSRFYRVGHRCLCHSWWTSNFLERYV